MGKAVWAVLAVLAIAAACSATEVDGTAFTLEPGLEVGLLGAEDTGIEELLQGGDPADDAIKEKERATKEKEKGAQREQDEKVPPPGPRPPRESVSDLRLPSPRMRKRRMGQRQPRKPPPRKRWRMRRQQRSFSEVCTPQSRQLSPARCADPKNHTMQVLRACPRRR